MRTRILIALGFVLSCRREGPPQKSQPAEAAAPTDKGDAMASTSSNPSPMAPASISEDIAFLEKHGKVIVLGGEAGAKVALSAQYQGRVMTSAVALNARSLGWIHRAFIEGKKTGTQFDNYGGEDRFWLGPEGGQFGLYFPPGRPFEFDAWQTPHAMQEGVWDIADQTATRATFRKTMSVTNWSNTAFTVEVDRAVQVLGRDETKKVLGLAAAPGPDVGFVAYETRNKITNGDKKPWKKESGLLSVWILAMYAPVPDTRVVVPFETTGPAKGTPIVKDDYFGKVPAERLDVREDKGYLLFKCDGKHRSKIGLAPVRAKSVLGSYSAQAKLLTIVHYDGPKKGAPHVNSMWENQKDPYAGDVVNSYNDGSPGPGKPPLGGFYEIETSSPGAELAPAQSLVHTQQTFHFVGEPAALEPIAKKVLGVSLAEIGH